MAFLECAGLAVLRCAPHGLSAWATEPFFPQASPWMPAFAVSMTMMGLLVLGSSFFLRREQRAMLQVHQERENLRREQEELQKTEDHALKRACKS